MNAKPKLERTWEAERGRIVAWVSSRVGEAEAEDILQDVLVRALSDLDALTPVRDLASWLWRGARNGVIDAWRRRSRRATSSFSDQALEVEALPDAGRSPHEDLERREDLDRVRRAVDALPEDQREVVVAQAIDGESFISISTRTGVPVATLAARKRRAVKRLAEYLDDDRQ